MYLPGTIRITQTAGKPPAQGELLVELVADDGTVLDSSPLIPLPAAKPVTYGKVFAEVKVLPQWTGVPDAPPPVPTNAVKTPATAAHLAPIAGTPAAARK